MIRAAFLKSAPLLFVVMWSTGFIGAKLGLPFVEPFTFLSYRYSIVVGIMLVLLLIKGGVPRVPTRIYFHFAVSGLLIHGVYLGGVFLGISLGMEAGYSSVIVSMQPVVTGLLAHYFVKEKLTRLKIIGFVLGLTGVMMILGNKTTGNLPVPYQALPVIISLLAISAGTVYHKKFCTGLDLRAGFLIQFATSLVFTLPVALIFETNRVEWSPQFIFALLWLVLVLSVGSISLMFYLMRSRGVVDTAKLFFLTPVSATILAWALFQEKLTPLILAGMALTILGVYLGGKPSLSFLTSLYRTKPKQP